MGRRNEDEGNEIFLSYEIHPGSGAQGASDVGNNSNANRRQKSTSDGIARPVCQYDFRMFQTGIRS
jgi:hypothetical protein